MEPVRKVVLAEEVSTAAVQPSPRGAVRF